MSASTTSFTVPPNAVFTSLNHCSGTFTDCTRRCGPMGWLKNKGVPGLSHDSASCTPPVHGERSTASSSSRGWSLTMSLSTSSGELLEAVLRSPWTGGLQLALSWLRPGTPLFFNQPIGPHRRVQSVKVPLQWFKDVKTAFGGTVNDVVLALIGEAMSRWLYERGDAHRYRLGNLVSPMVLEVPLPPMLPSDRVHMVTAATGDLKRSRQAVAAQTLTQLATWAPATLQNLAGNLMTTQMRWLPQSVINLVVTNIPGPQIPFYTGGSELIDVWPFVSVYHSLGLNIAIVSYNGSVFFGVLADRDLVPDLDDFAHHLEQAAADYHEAAIKPVRKRRAPATSRRRTARSREQPAKQAIDLGVDDQSIVAAPNGDRRDVRPEAAAEVHHLV